MMNSVAPVEPVAPWIGGKRNLAKRITAIVDSLEHVTYVEPFIGMGGVFFRRKMRPHAEVINDRNGEISNLFRILQRHYPQFLDCLKFQITTRAEFKRLQDTPAHTLTDLERAARFLYLQRTVFGGIVGGKSFGVSKGTSARFNLTTLEPMLEDLHTRLSGVVIECLDFSEVITTYDSSETFFYLDPPYWDSETTYGKDMFSKNSFVALAQQLSQIDGKFLLSINETPEIEDIFKDFEQDRVEVTYSVARKADSRGKRGELLVRNFDLSQARTPTLL